MIVCKDGCFALHTVYTNCQLRAGLPAIRGAHGATAHNARSHGKCACYPMENAHAIRRVGLSNILDREGRENLSGSSPMKRTHGTGVAPTLVGS